jgi:hypothetical protein
LQLQLVLERPIGGTTSQKAVNAIPAEDADLSFSQQLARLVDEAVKGFEKENQ